MSDEIKENLNKVCNARINSDPEFKERRFESRNDIVVIYDVENKNTMYCYSLEELQKILSSLVVVSEYDDGKESILLGSTTLFAKLPYWNIKIELFSFLYLLQNEKKFIELKRKEKGSLFFFAQDESLKVSDSSYSKWYKSGVYFRKNIPLSKNIHCVNVCLQNENIFAKTILRKHENGVPELVELVKIGNFESISIASHIEFLQWKFEFGDIPSLEVFDKNGKLTQTTFKNNLDQIIVEYWWKNEINYRENDLPSTIRYENEIKISELWTNDEGKISRGNDLPAEIDYFANGSIKEMVWYSGGLIHRENGPAYLRLNEDGIVITQRNYFFGKEGFMNDHRHQSYSKNRKI